MFVLAFVQPQHISYCPEEEIPVSLNQYLPPGYVRLPDLPLLHGIYQILCTAEYIASQAITFIGQGVKLFSIHKISILTSPRLSAGREVS